MKHAYLIIAHNEFEILSKLLQTIDDERNDIYIHFDRKLKQYPSYKTLHAKLFILTNRIDVRWGDVSVVEAEYTLFEEAHNRGGYSYYHLLSGVDIPLKSQDYIHSFFKENAGKEFIGYHQRDVSKEIERKVQKWHLFPKSFRGTKGMDVVLKRYLCAGCLRLQFLSGIHRNKSLNFKKGTQWISITNEFIGYLIEQKKDVMRTYTHSFCADEIFVQTICWNSSFRDRIYDINDEANGCLRMIGWKNNQLIEWQEKDFDTLMQSKSLFARKFSTKHIEVVNKIIEKIV